MSGTFKNIWLILMVFAAAGCATKNALDTRGPLQAAARGGDVEAQYQYGKLLCCGNGGGYDTVQALHWLCSAALKNHAGAQYALGRHYGWRDDTDARASVPQDRIYAYMWYSLAALQGMEIAASERDALAKDMTPMELADAADRARDWKHLGCPL